MSGDHWWWDMPEFVAAQRDPGFRSWVQSIDLGMDLGEEPFEEIIPGLSVREPFSDEGILAAEAAFLQTFPDERALDKNWHLMMRFVKYLGQAYVEKLECRWVWQPNIKPWDLSSPAIERPWPGTDMLLDLFPIMNATVRPPRRGDDWIFVFRNNRKRYEDWVEQGRPGFAEWKAHDQEIGAT